MVRSLVGTMVEVGQGESPPTRLAELLVSRARHLAGPTAPPRGLYLVEVFYENARSAQLSIRRVGWGKGPGHQIFP